ncbi:uncharacterized protein BP01DRAFT_370158 [Aspergillus saccharolyticus JOP 1030-1]|uniref:WSC domain-containing protein n=1 Tax=Aspergillus saccharolyticus JOP 1030-1 TaxID=1450539 RepID=A0A318Z1E6_9EURO|nr:hypothetical protein BP01DRAFT_370158 [Aspergillus saccharolyticus JOP 1030-1]PYH40107.1 hypothetical protein BP01DRAFT_370158 [Aspergillus saccharolyticus JOP 1030-1]
MKTPTYYLLAAASLPLARAGQSGSWDSLSCFTSIGTMQSMGSFEFQSVSYCIAQCEAGNTVFVAVQAEDCYCGTASLDLEEMALASDETACNLPCPGYAADTCGGDSAYSVWVSQDYIDSLEDSDDDDDDDNQGDVDDSNDNDNPDDNSGYDYSDEDQDGEDSDDSYYNIGNVTSSAVAIAVPTSTAISPVSTSGSGGNFSTNVIASPNATATSSAVVTSVTSTSGAGRRFRFLFF